MTERPSFRFAPLLIGILNLLSANASISVAATPEQTASEKCSKIEVRGTLRFEKNRSLSVIADEGTQNALRFQLSFTNKREQELAIRWLNQTVLVTGQIQQPLLHPQASLIATNVRLTTPDPLNMRKNPPWKILRAENCKHKTLPPQSR